ncbi:MAG: hypothetical protein QFB86_03395 [Patescibacteria group bacterium]|nr:hypothetical protein [Patescibacteria group bacterium]
MAVFTTTESTDYTAVWTVLKGQKSVSGLPTTKQPFSRDKLFMSIYKSVQHRPTALADAGGLTNTVIQKLLHQQPSDQLTAKQIAATAQVALHRFDSAASVHYAAFHKA